MHNAAFAAAAIDARYELAELDEPDVPPAVAAARGPGFLGLGVTAPYKQLVAGLVDEVEGDAAEIGAVNNVVRTDDGRLVGFNSDAPGFRAGVVVALGRTLTGLAVGVAGAGGAAHAVVHACVRGGVRGVTIANRSPQAAAQVAARFAGSANASGTTLVAVTYDDPTYVSFVRAADLAVNATTVGMLDPGMTIPIEELPGGATVFDLVYVPAETPLVRAARERGLRAANGSEMLIQQAAIAFERWTGISGMAGVMRAAVAPLLADPTTTA
jgi:shikimate dehydrogenase